MKQRSFMCLIRKKNNCANCVYNRDYMRHDQQTCDNWCSNNKSPYFLMSIADDSTCGRFAQKGRKAPLWMRILNKIL